MECPVYRKGETVGTLRAQDDGLYRVLRCSIGLCRELLRLYLPDGRALGVLAPEDGVLTCCRRVSRASLPSLPAYAVAWCEADGQWEQEGDEARRWTKVGVERAILWQTLTPLNLPAAPEQLTAVRIDERIYLSMTAPYQ